MHFRFYRSMSDVERRIIGILLAFILFLFFAAGKELHGADHKSKPTTPEDCSVLEGREHTICERAQEIETRDAEKKAEKTRAQNESPAMSKARKELENRTKREAKDERALARSGVKGCDGKTALWVNSEFTKPYSGLTSITFNISNQTSEPLNITFDSTGGMAVCNLAPGQRVTLVRHLADEFGLAGQYPVSYTAIGSNGSNAHSGQYILFPGGIRQILNWDIKQLNN